VVLVDERDREAQQPGVGREVQVARPRARVGRVVVALRVEVVVRQPAPIERGQQVRRRGVGVVARAAGARVGLRAPDAAAFCRPQQPAAVLAVRVGVVGVGLREQRPDHAGRGQRVQRRVQRERIRRREPVGDKARRGFGRGVDPPRHVGRPGQPG